MCAFVMADIVYLCGLVLAVLYWGWRGGNFACMHAKRMYIYEKASFLLGGAEPADALVVECVGGSSSNTGARFPLLEAVWSSETP